MTERVAGSVDTGAARVALATTAGAVERHTAELNRAIDYGIELERLFRAAARLDEFGRSESCRWQAPGVDDGWRGSRWHLAASES